MGALPKAAHLLVYAVAVAAVFEPKSATYTYAGPPQPPQLEKVPAAWVMGGGGEGDGGDGGGEGGGGEGGGGGDGGGEGGGGDDGGDEGGIM